MSDDVFLRKDTFDETMKRIEAMIIGAVMGFAAVVVAAVSVYVGVFR